MKIDTTELLFIVSLTITFLSTLIGIIWNFINKKIDKMEISCSKNNDEIIEIKSEQKADHIWIVNIDSKISDLRKSIQERD